MYPPCPRLLLILVASALASSPCPAQRVVTTRVSIAWNGAESNLANYAPAIAGSARYVTFASVATNLVPGDTNNQIDVFLRDPSLGTTTRISVGPRGEGDGRSSAPSIAGDGSVIAFESLATNLVNGDSNGQSDIFVYSRITGAVTRVSVDSIGRQANGASQDAAISEDGRYVAFSSVATDLVVGDTNGQSDIFVHDRLLGQTTRVSVSSAGVEGNLGSFDPTISGDGRFVGFDSWSSNLVPGDTNAWGDVFLHDRIAGRTERVSVGSAGQQGDDESWEPSLSVDGRFIAFTTWATNLVLGDQNGVGDVLVRELATGLNERASLDSYGREGDGDSHAASMSADGRFVTFLTAATNLAPGDHNSVEDVVVHDRRSGVTDRVNLHSSGVEANRNTDAATISSDGRYVVFRSFATNLVAGDTNGHWDVFVHDRITGGAEVTIQNLVAGQVATIGIRGATPTGTLVLGLSLAGQGAFGSPWGILDLALPIALVIVTADGSGNVSLPVFVPGALVGWPVWLQGIDLVADQPTTSFGRLVR